MTCKNAEKCKAAIWNPDRDECVCGTSVRYYFYECEYLQFEGLCEYLELEEGE